MKKLCVFVFLAILLAGCAVPAVEMEQPEAPQPMETFFSGVFSGS